MAFVVSSSSCNSSFSFFSLLSFLLSCLTCVSKNIARPAELGANINSPHINVHISVHIQDSLRDMIQFGSRFAHPSKKFIPAGAHADYSYKYRASHTNFERAVCSPD